MANKKIAVNDVAPANEVAAEPSAKPIIVTNRTIIKDPMMLDNAQEDTSVTADTEVAKVKHEVKLKPPTLEPLKLPTAEEVEAEPAVPAEPAKKAEPEAPPSNDAPAAEDKPKDVAAEEAEVAAKQLEHEANIQKLIDNKQYELPINSVEKRRSKRFVSLGILLSLVLLVAWADVALDAGLIQLRNLKPVTHFFSN